MTSVNISVIVPVYNGEMWIDSCFESILQQTILNDNDVKIEISIFNDASNDSTLVILNKWEKKITAIGMLFTLTNNTLTSPKGVGYAKNAAVNASCGEYLCFQDIDDIMLSDRLLKQFTTAQNHRNAIIGCKFKRDPENSTERFTNWANNLNENELNKQIYTSHGPTVIMPTWFMHRNVFSRIGGFSEEQKGCPEDLIFFYEHLDKKGDVIRVNECLLIYRYIPTSTTFSVQSTTIWNIKLQHFLKTYLPKWKDGFTVWNAGRLGRLLIKSLNEEQTKLVRALCDVDINKIGQHYEYYCPKKRKPLCRIPIVHFQMAQPPFVICMKLDMTGGEFERNLSSLNLTEGKDYVIFN